MAADPAPHPSFSPGRKWSIGLNVFLIIVVVLSVVVMVNYLSRDYYRRFHCSAAGKVELSPRTLDVLKALTNNVKIILYYNKTDPLYSTIAALLNEYKLHNPKIAVQTIDLERDAAAAQKVKAAYKLGSATDKNLVIIDCDGNSQVIPGNALAEYTLEKVAGEQENKYRTAVTAFKGEMMFTSVLLALSNPKTLKSYALQGHGEHRIDNGDERQGYLKFASVLQQNRVQVEPLTLLGTNSVPSDCNLLIIAGPTTAIPESELEKIEQYLNQGGRLLALFNADSMNKIIGLEKILAKWGVAIGPFIVADPDKGDGDSIVVDAFSKHPVVNSLLGSGLYLTRPRPVARIKSTAAQPADAPKIEPLAFSSPKAFGEDDPAKKTRQFPFLVAVEKGAIKGVISERGATRIVVGGDSLFLANHHIDELGNRDFVGFAADWLLDRTRIVEGLGPKPIREFRLIMTRAQLQTAQWLMLAGMPGAALLVGALVWLRRRR